MKNMVAQECKDQRSNPNRIAQRRMYITPTVKIIAPMQIEQSNSILRVMKNCIEYLVRISVMSESMQDEWFNST